MVESFWICAAWPWYSILMSRSRGIALNVRTSGRRHISQCTHGERRGDGSRADQTLRSAISAPQICEGARVVIFRLRMRSW